MKEKQFDHIENKIKAAAENSEPDFDEQSWQKMELLLDKENDRKRPVAWFLVPVLLCALVAAYFIFKTDSPRKQLAVSSKINIASQKEKIKGNNTEAIVTKHLNNPIDTAVIPTAVENAIPVNLTTNATTKNKNTRNIHSSRIKISGSNSIDNNLAISDQNAYSFHPVKRAVKGKTKVSIQSSYAESNDESGMITEETDKTIPVSSLTKSTTVTTVDSTTITLKTTTAKDTIQKKKPEEKATATKEKTKRSSRFYFLATAGAEASSVKFLSTSNSAAVAKYGLGVGYQLTKKLSVQTGFNVSRKKYIAGAGDYNAKAGSYWSMVEIKKVDANCLVYEIPLAVRYDFIKKNKFSFFATAGVSSFIMKREDYRYDYIRDYNAYQRSWTYTGNKNFFSVVTVSAGVERKISNNFSLLAEPSISLPFSGVGDGKVKLYSMGLQLGVKYKLR